MRTKRSEIAVSLQELDRLTSRFSMSRSERSRADFLMTQISVLRSEDRSAVRSRGLSRELRAWSFALQGHGCPDEFRDLAEGVAGFLSWTATGGYLVPFEFYSRTVDAMAQVDPLLSEDDVRLIREGDQDTKLEAVPGPRDGKGLDKNVMARNPGVPLRPMQLAGWDLSTIASQQIAEGSQDVTTIPSILGEVLNGYMHRATLGDVSFQIEQDSFEVLIDLLSQAYAVAFARGMGKQLVTGSGSGQPQGVLTAAKNSGYTTAAAGAISLADLVSIYGSVDRIYRASPKARWLMSDATYLLVRQAQTSAGVPLFPPGEDTEEIFGKKVLVSPSMPSGVGTGRIVFGDFSHFVVRLSGMGVQRTIETRAEGADYLSAAYHGRMRVDSSLFDPSGGNTPPIVYASLHA